MLVSVFDVSELLGCNQRATLFCLHLSLKINSVRDILLLFVDENLSVLWLFSSIMINKSSIITLSLQLDTWNLPLCNEQNLEALSNVKPSSPARACGKQEAQGWWKVCVGCLLYLPYPPTSACKPGTLTHLGWGQRSQK